MSVICIHHRGIDPYFNLAAEEYLLKNFKEDIFMIWQSEPSIVVGKHQNALAEINHQFVRDSQIKVARRISGGGTVFHDPGNLNFTFIKQVDRIDQVNFKNFTKPVLAVLNKMSLAAYTSGRNDLLLDGKKISGNAEHVFKKRILHHGTLLFNSKLDHLKQALKVDLSRFTHKAVQSNRSEVTNIAEYLSKQVTIDQFASAIFEGISSSYPEKINYSFSEKDRKTIQQMSDEKYSQWDWIYGYSPKYSYTNSFHLAKGDIQFSFWVEKGKIQRSEWKGQLPEKIIAELNDLLKNCKHDYNELSERLQPVKKTLQMLNISLAALLDQLV